MGDRGAATSTAQQERNEACRDRPSASLHDAARRKSLTKDFGTLLSSRTSRRAIAAIADPAWSQAEWLGVITRPDLVNGPSKSSRICRAGGPVLHCGSHRFQLLRSSLGSVVQDVLLGRDDRSPHQIALVRIFKCGCQPSHLLGE